MDFKLHTPDQLWETVPPTEYIVSDFLPTGSLAVLSGDAATFKTYLLINIAVAVATGEQWQGRNVKKGNVLIVDEESGDNRLRSRIQENLRGYGIPQGQEVPIFYLTKNNFDASEDKHIKYLEAIIAQHDIKFVFLDSLARITPGLDENNTKTMRPPLDELQAIAQRRNCTIVIIHHNNRSGTYAGAHGLRDAVDYHFEITRANNVITLKADKARDYAEDTLKESYVLSLEDGIFTLTGSQHHANQEQLNKIVEIVRGNPEISMRKLAQELDGNQQKNIEAIKLAEEQGLIKDLIPDSKYKKYVVNNSLEDEIITMFEKSVTVTKALPSVTSNTAK